MLEVRALSCERNRRPLFENLSFTVSGGQLLRIEGGNGSGKTTLLRILCGLYVDHEGEVDWDLPDFPLFVSHRPGVKDVLTPLENLGWLCEVFGQPMPEARLLEALDTVGLLRYADQPCGALSEGQRKRVNLARLFVLDSPAWILDEPFSAIDAAGVRQLIDAIEAQLEKGGLVLLTSHQPLDTRAPTTTLRLGE
ncbi:MAG: cytochrome c biogenesis heme-transporting ATPase CcmA [Gammaproteobacteria bacterium]|nr:cytochrome c biogenesis heme-transporting ATPase CcmA [Gammaproteobacteria bacterium]